MNDELRSKPVSKSLIVILVVVIVIVVLLWVFEIPRYLRMDKHTVDAAIQGYHSKPKASKSRVVVTMTTIPPRVEYLKPTIMSLLDQSVRVDEIALNIPWKSRKGQRYQLPAWLSEIPIVKIHRVPKDLGPGTKILPTLKRESKDTRVIAVDDDNIYASKMIEKLVQEFDKYDGKCAITNYGMKLSQSSHDHTALGDVKFHYRFPYRWDRILKCMSGAREVDFLQGCSGFLVTPKMFLKGVHDLNSGPSEAVNVDDMWLSGWLHLNNVEIRQPAMNIRFFPIPYVKSLLNTPSLIAAEESEGKRNNKIVIEWFRKQGVKLCCDKCTSDK